MKLHVVDTVAPRVFARARHQAVLAFHASDGGHSARKRQGEVAQTAEQIEYAVARLRIEQGEGVVDHAPVHGAVDLHEVQRKELEFHRVVRQGEPQRNRFRPQRVHAVVAAGLQEDGQALLLREGDEGCAVAVGQRLQVAQHQRRGVVTAGDFDLRNLAHRIETADELTQRPDALAHGRHQHLAVRDVGDVAAVLLAETDQGLALLVHVLHRQPPATPVTPGLTDQRLEPASRRDLADALEVLREHALLGGDLRGRRQMLQRASAAGTEMRAARLDARGSPLATSP